MDPKNLRTIKTRTGIVGIERGIQEKQRATDETISEAFQDLRILMNKAHEMVTLSKTISNKIKDKQGEITEDETVQFKSYLMSLGIDDPVTREGCKSNSQYLSTLANQICDVLVTPITELGGIMTLPTAYCRVNRARGFDLISPEDLLHACQQLESLRLPLILRRLGSGVLVLQLSSLDDESLAKDTADRIKRIGSISAVDLAQDIGVPVAVAQERLQIAERIGLVVRDDSSSGVQYFFNLLLYPDDELVIPYLY